MAPIISADGRWWWDGARWRSRVVEGELELFWFTTTPEWQGRVLLMGLIGLIPIAGGIVVYGWALTVVDRIRGGWRELPAADFSYLDRGVSPFITLLVYGLGAAFVFIALVVLAFAIGVADHALIPLALAIVFVAVLLVATAWLLLLYCFAALLLISDSQGVAAALDPRRVWAAARANHNVSLRAAVIYLAATGVVLVVIVPTSFIIPFGGLLAGLALPTVFALMAPALAAFRSEPGQL